MCLDDIMFHQRAQPDEAVAQPDEAAVARLGDFLLGGPYSAVVALVVVVASCAALASATRLAISARLAASAASAGDDASLGLQARSNCALPSPAGTAPAGTAVDLAASRSSFTLCRTLRISSLL